MAPAVVDQLSLVAMPRRSRRPLQRYRRGAAGIWVAYPAGDDANRKPAGAASDLFRAGVS